MSDELTEREQLIVDKAVVEMSLIAMRVVSATGLLVSGLLAFIGLYYRAWVFSSAMWVAVAFFVYALRKTTSAEVVMDGGVDGE